MLARKGDLGRAHSLLTVLCRQFHDWGIPVWQRKCAQALDALYLGTRHCIPDTLVQPLLPGLQKGRPTPVGALTELLCISEIKVDTPWHQN
jgi:hypothetical protein